MHAIVFEGTTEERGRPPDVQGMTLYGDASLRALKRGDVLWVATRTGGSRGTPALCGRLLVDRVESRTADDPLFPSDRMDRTHRLIVTRDGSERCLPFECGSIASWDIWRRPFGGLVELSDEQGSALDGEWSRASRQSR